MGAADRWGEVGLGVLRAAAAEAPREAGVYLFLGERGEVLYVGKAGDLRQRLRQHAGVRGPGSGLDERYDLVRRVVWEVAVDEAAAVWREAELIFALRPPFNANTGLRGAAAVGMDPRAPYVVVREVAAGVLGFSLEPVLPSIGRAYGCFPHLGKGVASRLGIACSDGYTALLRLLWAAAGEGSHTPASITRSAPESFTVAVSAEVRDGLHRFLSGTRARLAEELLEEAAHRPEFMQPALRRDKEAALQFYAGGPQLVRARRLRHGVRARVLEAETYRSLVRDEISPVING
ncbi:GIY-YIG catalytic domain-containing protein [Kribbella orskensis]|uniref:GIY-YIG catalytic domain-containing protein n=1 Tax=Kribbella orskensis TaxID=2512216 RepID=A0ABY2BID0_9ACTN|nr:MULTISPECIES: nucleotide excision repair endonuclease [Kribbella]TCN39048.1 GIY-YIG catalytic domain-containing protein [Kribbella sp. VKM Ac-2500]TCO21695.1 GIY-YIG catalytic domain-containing protein [Kribbella orskensis]